MKTNQSSATPFWRLGAFLVCLLGVGLGCATDRAVWTSPEDIGTGEFARVIVPNEVELVSVDGQSVHGISFLRFRERRDLLLNPGPHRLVVRMRPAYDLADEDHAVVVTEARTIEFVAAPEGRYRIAFRRAGRPSPGFPAGDVPAIWLEEVPE